MISIKNKVLGTTKTNMLCKIHNGNNNSEQKVCLCTCRNQRFIKTYHPLKQKKVKLRKLSFAITSEAHTNIAREECEKGASPLLSRRYTTMPLKNSDPAMEWSDESSVIDWLLSVGIKIKRISNKQYFLDNRVCFFNNVLIFANRKRVEMGLAPFYIKDILEF